MPIPLEALVAPLMMARYDRALGIALTIWLGCLAGALSFYAIGGLLFEPLVEPVLQTLGLATEFDDMGNRLDQEGVFWAVFLISISPVPFQLATLGAGSAGVDPTTFTLAVASSRGLRYFGLAILALTLGPRLTHVLNHGPVPVIAIIVALVLGYVAFQILR